jgi:hypothetical protein
MRTTTIRDMIQEPTSATSNLANKYTPVIYLVIFAQHSACFLLEIRHTVLQELESIWFVGWLVVVVARVGR